MSQRGYVALVLHAHLPYVRHPEHPKFLEETWLFEALTESYLPLLSVLDRLASDGVDFRLTVGLSPPLVAMLRDPLLQERYVAHLDSLIELAERESDRQSRHAELGRTAQFYAERFNVLRRNYTESLDRDVVGAFARLQDAGCVEIITTAATHGYLPHLRATPASIRAQIDVGVESYRWAFGRDPEGFWLPECAYFPGLDRFLAAAGVRYFFVESHGLLHADPAAQLGTYAPVVCPSGVAAFARDAETSRIVWSMQEGYPGDPEYRDFYKDLGFDGPREAVRHVLGPDGIRVATGLKYHRVTGPTPHKLPYVRERALERVEAHAADFVTRVTQRLEGITLEDGRTPIIVAPYDAELLGHWWFEGPEWLDRVLRRFASRGSTVPPVTPSEYLAEYPDGQVATPSESSWGSGGYHEVWLNAENDRNATRLLSASESFETLVRDASAADGVERRVLDQAARELLLAQASDWPFLQRSRTAPEYARKRVEEHLERFEILARASSGATGGNGGAAGVLDQLTEIEERDAIFPWIDHRVFSPIGPSAVEVSEDAPVERVAFLSAEAAPWAKTGGLGDVIGALPAALAGLGVDVTLLLPGYRTIDRSQFGAREVFARLQIGLGGGVVQTFRVLEVEPPARGVRVLLIDHPGSFDRGGIYTDPASGEEYPDSARRFAIYAKAALETLSAIGERVDVLHCHDHQTAIALAFQRLHYRDDPAIGGAASVFTLHNLGYQGTHPPEILDDVGIGREWYWAGSPFEFDGQVNLMKIGIVLADKVNAVSERYAREICEDPKLVSNLRGVLVERGSDLVGILNGIDVDEWNPANDPHIPKSYSADKPAGKRAAKKKLLETMGLSTRRLDSTPLVGMVTRLVDQKGLDLVEEALADMLDLGINLVVLGTGLPKYHEVLEQAAKDHPRQVGVALRFDNGLAHLIEAGSDMFLMPSLYEPCGLNQLYSLRYGTVPVVRATGGLADTVQDDDEEPGAGVGFSFSEYTAEAMLDALERAIAAFSDRDRWKGLVERSMRRDHSWSASARKYLDLYRVAAARRRRAAARDGLVVVR